jgi:hypothetical protein
MTSSGVRQPERLVYNARGRRVRARATNMGEDEQAEIGRLRARVAELEGLLHKSLETTRKLAAQRDVWEQWYHERYLVMADISNALLALVVEGDAEGLPMTERQQKVEAILTQLVRDFQALGPERPADIPLSKRELKDRALDLFELLLASGQRPTLKAIAEAFKLPYGELRKHRSERQAERDENRKL